MTCSLDAIKKTGLSGKQQQSIMDIGKNLQIMADISQADIFIDCLLPEGEAAIVVAEARPATTQSLYNGSVLGQIAYEENEPGVLFSLKSGKSVLGSRGISQERVVMQQDIVPIADETGTTIGVLIKEKDISQVIQQEKKVKTLMNKSNSKEKERLMKSVVIQEIHHRVKNNLQIISSLLRLQMRRTSSEEVAEVFRDSVNRISSMAMVHDYLARNGIEEVDAKRLMEQIAELLISSSTGLGQQIHFSIEGQPLFLTSDKATCLSLVVNELLQNSIKHAFHSRAEGSLDISVNCRKQMAHVTIADDGCGIEANFPPEQKTSFGLQLVKTLVEEDLEGVLSFFHSDKGTKASITFPI